AVPRVEAERQEATLRALTRHQERAVLALTQHTVGWTGDQRVARQHLDVVGIEEAEDRLVSPPMIEAEQLELLAERERVAACLGPGRRAQVEGGSRLRASEREDAVEDREIERPRARVAGAIDALEA